MVGRGFSAGIRGGGTEAPAAGAAAEAADAFDVPEGSHRLGMLNGDSSTCFWAALLSTGDRIWPVAPGDGSSAGSILTTAGVLIAIGGVDSLAGSVLM